MSRPSLGTGFIDRLEGDSESKRRVRICMATIYDQMSVEEAIKEIGLCKQAFYEARDRILCGAIEGATPKPSGRHPKSLDAEELKRQEEGLAKLERDLRIRAEGLRIREELGLVLGSRLGKKNGRKSGKKGL